MRGATEIIFNPRKIGIFLSMNQMTSLPVNSFAADMAPYPLEWMIVPDYPWRVAAPLKKRTAQNRCMKTDSRKRGPNK